MNALKRPDWYLSEVTPIVSRPWTDREKIAVYRLRLEDKLPVERVATIFGLTKTQVHNTTRMVKKSRQRQCCSCGYVLTEEELKQKKMIKSCDKCKERRKIYKRKRRKRLIKKNICPICEKNPLVTEKKACKGCLSATHRRRYNQGICGTCGKEPIAWDRSDALGINCLEKNRLRASKARKAKS